MYHQFDIAVNKTTGVPIPGTIVRVFDGTDNVVPIYADENETPIETVSGIANAAVADSAGNYSFFVDDGVYTLRLYSGDTLVLTVPNYPMPGTISAANATFLQSGTGAVLRTMQDKARETKAFSDYTTNQSAIDAALGSNGGVVKAVGAPALGASLVIDRPVDTTVGDFNICGAGNGSGFQLPNATFTAIDSSLPVGADPLSECVNIRDAGFYGANAAASAYVLSHKFLRYTISGTRLDKMKIVNSPIYLQSVRILDSSVWNHQGVAVQAAGTLYDFSLAETRFERGGSGIKAGTGFGVRVCNSLFQAGSGSFFDLAAVNGALVAGNYTEGNGAFDYRFTDPFVGGVSRGVVFAGNAMSSTAIGYNVRVGDVRGGVSLGNYCTGDLFDLSATRLGGFVSICDYAGGVKFSDDRFWEGTASGVFPLVTGITAYPAGGQASAAKLTKPVNRVTTTTKSGSANASVALPPTDDVVHGDYGKEVIVINSGADALDVFYDPADVANLGGGGGRATAFVIPPKPNGNAVKFVCGVFGNWVPLAIPPAAYQADSVATTVAGLVSDFNALLAKLRAAGIQLAN